MNKIKSKEIKEIQEKNMIKYARVECCSCHEAFYVRVNDPSVFVVPDFIEEGEVFSCGECPLCEFGTYVRFIIYIDTVDNKAGRG